MAKQLPPIADALLFSRNYANASPYLNQTAKELILGLCNLLEQAAADPTVAAPATPITGRYGEVLGPFVELMERELHANSGKGDRPGWLSMSRSTALLEIYYHVAKLQKAVNNDDMPLIREHAADVANMSMMLLDVCGGLTLARLELA